MPAIKTPKLFSPKPILPHANSVLSAPGYSAKHTFKTILENQSIGAYATKNGNFFYSVDAHLYEQINAAVNAENVKKLPSAIIDHRS